jgi:hypothetical protein
MVDEYRYVMKKEKALGKDVFVTDKVRYNHSTGTISYNDFSIGSRVRDTDGYCATVRYIGPVAVAKVISSSSSSSHRHHYHYHPSTTTTTITMLTMSLLHKLLEYRRTMARRRMG